MSVKITSLSFVLIGKNPKQTTMSNKKSHKEQERKRKQQLEARANIDAFRTQLEMKIRNRFPELGTDHPAVVAEMDAICTAGLAEGMIILGKMMTGIRTEMGVNPEADKGSLIGSIVPYVLGITMENPIENGQLDSTLANAAEIKIPLQVRLYFDNEVRNQVVEWVKAHYPNVTTRLGQPIVKLPNVVAEFKKVVKDPEYQHLLEQ